MEDISKSCPGCESDSAPHLAECYKRPPGTVNCLGCGKPIDYMQGTCPHCGYKEF
jgi:ribosomal protein S27E